MKKLLFAVTVLAVSTAQADTGQLLENPPDASDGQGGGNSQPFSVDDIGTATGTISGTTPGLLVSSASNDSVLHYDGITGSFIGVYASGGGLSVPEGLRFGPDDNLYVSSFSSDSVLRYDGQTGVFLDVFASGLNLAGPFGLQFGSDGNLYVSSRGTNNVLRFNGQTGAFIDTFATGGGLQDPEGLTFGPDGNLYVSNDGGANVLRYDGVTGGFIDVFAAGGGLSGPEDLLFGPDGNLYVSSFGSDNVLRYDGSTGNFLGVFAEDASLNSPSGLVFGTDGSLYVSGFNSNNIVRFDGATGAFVDVFAAGGELASPTYLTFLGDACLTQVSIEVVCHADGTTFTVNIEGINACTGGTSMFTFTASGGAVGEALCFTLLVDDGGFCCSTEICVTIPDCLSETLVCDFDGLPGGDIVTNQYPGATFSSSAGNDNKVHPFFVNDTPPNILCTGPVGAPVDCVAPTFIDFTNPVDSLAFYAIGVNDVGPVADVNVFIGNVFDSTVPVIGAGTPNDNILIDLSPFTNVTRIELTNITDFGGIGWDTFSFSVTALPSDLDGDGIVGMVDFLALLAAWGSCSDCGTTPADFDGDCSVGILDLLILLGNWG